MCLDHLWVPVRSLGPGPRASFVLKRIGPGLSTCSLASRRRNAGEPLARLPLAFTQGGGNKKWERAVRRGGGGPGRGGGGVGKEDVDGWPSSIADVSTRPRCRRPTRKTAEKVVPLFEFRNDFESLLVVSFRSLFAFRGDGRPQKREIPLANLGRRVPESMVPYSKRLLATKEPKCGRG